jgi:uncharacterized membrane protein
MLDLFIVTEVGVALIFLACLVHSMRKGKRYLFLLLLALAYAILFENLNIALSDGKMGSYYYNPNLSFFIFDLPVFVALAWSSLIYSTYFLTESIGVKEFSKPFVDALLVVLVDLAVDVFAIRFGFWHWRGYSLTEGWFGVPASNFIGWLLVVFFFMFFYRRISQLKIKPSAKYALQFLSILPAYLLELASFSILEPLAAVLTKKYELLVFLFLVAVFLFFIRKGKKNKNPRENIHLFVRVPFYLFGFYGMMKFYSTGVVFSLAFVVLVTVEAVVAIRASLKR